MWKRRAFYPPTSALIGVLEKDKLQISAEDVGYIWVIAYTFQPYYKSLKYPELSQSEHRHALALTVYAVLVSGCIVRYSLL